ncbi:MAG: serine hydroxymethyltransferase [Deltaproteobacteria bacterium]|nr:MAG: serine hydroxymethyltransferase [Deltaproteobacteria bacterium]
MSALKLTDPEIAEAIRLEKEREELKLGLIASENFVSEAVREAAGSVMTNKYAEGYPGKRYYGGCEYVDIAEELAISRAKELFRVDAVNVQPHSGCQANMAVYFSVLNPGDTILAMDLKHGGHISHGSPVSFSGKLYRTVNYGVTRDTHRIDFNQVRDMTKKHRPKLIIAGASSYPRAIDFRPFREIADEVGAMLMADIAHPVGLVAAGLHPSPVPWAEFVTATTHKTMRGPRGGIIMCKEEFAPSINNHIFPGMQGGPLMHIIAAKAVAFKEALTPEFTQYQKQVIDNAQALAQEIANHGFDLVSGGTDNHLILIDLTNRKITGKDALDALGMAGIVLNKNIVPFDPRPPAITSGIRIGTPAVTTRGMKEEQMKIIAGFINQVLHDINNIGKMNRIKNEVREFCQEFPVYLERLVRE